MPDQIEERFKHDLVEGNARDAANVLHEQLMHNPREANKLIHESEKWDRQGVNLKEHGFPEHVGIRDDILVGPQGQVAIRDKATGQEGLIGQIPREMPPQIAQPGMYPGQFQPGAYPQEAAPPPGAYPPPEAGMQPGMQQGNPNQGGEVAAIAGTAAIAGLIGFLAGRDNHNNEVIVEGGFHHRPVFRPHFEHHDRWR